MTIALATVESPSFWMQAITLAVVGIFITVAVYGAVALIVKMDDIGLHMAANRKTAAARAFGRGLVIAMPKLMSFLSTVGTLAMLWVGGNIVVHGLEVTHLWALPYETIHPLGRGRGTNRSAALAGFTEWLVTAACDGVIGLALGTMLIPIATRIIAPAFAAITGKKKAAH